ncbi:glucosaminidase domain-containing protein [Treponema putidum]|uniref:Glucosaminidase n=1 Tax=Treponema putidum TaxID=221027 RepID=A0AAE9MUB7_9SPIR|nr:glucosaminidase domain-containing protein [Treponema putidum]AIN93329.1 glucosaminidase [Treponema putidum]TWI72970.1 mannosyl-glycoprotein endo-beta-N-acetylglucosaminidase [Treponema putidum]UTY32055.1 glucosaminidase [Treponema putidum]UTY34434.1 glucosaminidase [Treponema putidum]
MKRRIFYIFIFCLSFLFFSCLSFFVRPPHFIESAGRCSAEELTAFFISQNPKRDRAKVKRLARFYIEECEAEGINSDIAFSQMCLETGFLNFGGLVSEDMNNFCGLGSIGAGKKGESFPTEKIGVLAHVQHLKAYATSKPLLRPPTDPRYKYVNPKGKAPTIYELAGTWAADPNYGKKLESILIRLYKSVY